MIPRVEPEGMLFRKPVSTPDQVRDRLFRDHALMARASTISARLASRVTLVTAPNGQINALLDGYPQALGAFSAAAAERTRHLHKGVPLASFTSSRRAVDKELE